jgi:phage N-6-adenine-methyltransferase
MSDLISSDLDDDIKNSWGTDPAVFDALNKEFNFCLDAAANKENHKCDWYHSKESDGLSIDWSDGMDRYDRNYPTKISRNVWINPPYGKGYIKKFMQKCIEQKAKGVTSVMLVPATMDAQ